MLLGRIPTISAHIKKYISPSLLVYSKKEAREKLAYIQKQFPLSHLHVDVSDNKFVPSQFWCRPHGYKDLSIRNSFDAHLMTYHPGKRVSAWKRAGATRIVFHYEATSNPLGVIDVIRKHRLEAGIALNLDTSVSAVELLLERLDAILFMGIVPGWSGQPFHREVIGKIRAFHKKYPEKLVIIDGGVSSQNAQDLLDAGAQQLVSASMIYGKDFSPRHQ